MSNLSQNKSKSRGEAIVELAGKEGAMNEWLAIVERARRALTPDGFRQWMFTVGNSGTLEERCALGSQALEMLTHQPLITIGRLGPSEFKSAEKGRQ